MNILILWSQDNITERKEEKEEGKKGESIAGRRKGSVGVVRPPTGGMLRGRTDSVSR